MEEWPFFLENFYFLSEIFSTGMHAIFASEIFHILYLGISNFINTFMITKLSSEDILFHPRSLVGKQIRCARICFQSHLRPILILWKLNAISWLRDFIYIYLFTIPLPILMVFLMTDSIHFMMEVKYSRSMGTVFVRFCIHVLFTSFQEFHYLLPCIQYIQKILILLPHTEYERVDSRIFFKGKEEGTFMNKYTI